MQRRFNTLQGRIGGSSALRALSGATVTVYLPGTTTKASLFSDAAGTVSLSNPVTTNEDGEYSYYAANRRYDEAFAPAAGSGFVSETVSDSALLFDPANGSALVTPIEKGAVYNGVTDDATALGLAIAASPGGVYYPAGTIFISAKPSGFNAHRRKGLGIVNLNSTGLIYPDDDILRYDPNADGGDYSIRLTRNRADINADATKTGFYFYQSYTSSRTTSSLFGYAANIKRSGGGSKVVPGQFNGFAMDGASDTVWGVATEAWSGDSTTEPTGSSTLVGAEFAVHSQRHDNSLNIIGADHVFYLKPGSGGDVLHGSLGSNAYNLNSKAVQISVGFNEARPASGAYNGWNTGIYFGSNSLDRSTSRLAYGIDMGDVDATRVLAFLRIPKTGRVAMGQPSGGGGIEDGFVYLDSGSRRRIELQRDVLGAAPTTALILDMSSTGPTGTVMAYDQTQTTVGAAGAGSALPATPTKYVRVRDGGTNYVIPLYLAS